MKNEAIRLKCRKAEEHAALMVRSCKSVIAYCFGKGDVKHNSGV